jgi:hypothetical protein
LISSPDKKSEARFAVTGPGIQECASFVKGRRDHLEIISRHNPTTAHQRPDSVYIRCCPVEKHSVGLRTLDCEAFMWTENVWPDLYEPLLVNSGGFVHGRYVNVASVDVVETEKKKEENQLTSVEEN